VPSLLIQVPTLFAVCICSHPTVFGPIFITVSGFIQENLSEVPQKPSVVFNCISCRGTSERSLFTIRNQKTLFDKERDYKNRHSFFLCMVISVHVKTNAISRFVACALASEPSSVLTLGLGNLEGRDFVVPVAQMRRIAGKSRARTPEVRIPEDSDLCSTENPDG
jgi:hypothetical protein